VALRRELRVGGLVPVAIEVHALEIETRPVARHAAGPEGSATPVSGPVLARPRRRLPLARSRRVSGSSSALAGRSPAGKSAGVEITCRVYKPPHPVSTAITYALLNSSGMSWGLRSREHVPCTDRPCQELSLGSALEPATTTGASSERPSRINVCPSLTSPPPVGQLRFSSSANATATPSSRSCSSSPERPLISSSGSECTNRKASGVV